MQAAELGYRGARAHRPRRRLRLARVRARRQALRRPADHRRGADARRPLARHAPRRDAAGLREPLPAAHRRARGHTARGKGVAAAPRIRRSTRRCSRSSTTGSSASPAARVTDSRCATRTPPRAWPTPSAASASSSSCSDRTSAATRGATRVLRDLAESLGVPTVATGDVHAHHPRRATLQDVLVAIATARSLDGCERSGAATTSPSCSRRPRCVERFPDDRAAVARTVELAERLAFDLTRGARLPLSRLLRQPGAGRSSSSRRSATARSRSAIAHGHKLRREARDTARRRARR